MLKLFKLLTCDIMKQLGLPRWFIVGLDMWYFDLQVSKVDPWWVNIKIEGTTKKLGLIKVTSEGDFSDAQSVRLYYDVYDAFFANVSKVKVKIIGSDGYNNTILLPPKGDIILREGFMGLRSSVEYDIAVEVEAPYVYGQVNLTSIIGKLDLLRGNQLLQTLSPHRFKLRLLVIAGLMCLYSFLYY